MCMVIIAIGVVVLVIFHIDGHNHIRSDRQKSSLSHVRLWLRFLGLFTDTAELWIYGWRRGYKAPAHSRSSAPTTPSLLSKSISAYRSILYRVRRGGRLG